MKITNDRNKIRPLLKIKLLTTKYVDILEKTMKTVYGNQKRYKPRRGIFMRGVI